MLGLLLCHVLVGLLLDTNKNRTLADERHVELLRYGQLMTVIASFSFLVLLVLCDIAKNDTEYLRYPQIAFRSRSQTWLL